MAMGEVCLMNYTSVTNPVWNADHTVITVDVVFPDHSASPVKFNAMASDPMPYGVQLFDELVALKYGPIAEPVAG